MKVVVIKSPAFISSVLRVILRIKKEDSEIPAHKIGKQWKFKKSELDEWVKSGKSAMN